MGISGSRSIGWVLMTALSVSVAVACGGSTDPQTDAALGAGSEVGGSGGATSDGSGAMAGEGSTGEAGAGSGVGGGSAEGGSGGAAQGGSTAAGGEAGQGPAEPAKSALYGSVRVFAKDEGQNEGNISKPRMYVENQSSAEVTGGFEVRYYFTVSEDSAPALDVYFSPEAQVSLVHSGGPHYYASLVYSRTLLPGDKTEDGNGAVFGLHLSSWASWDKTDDPSNLGLSGEFVETANIGVFDGSGLLLSGTVPASHQP